MAVYETLDIVNCIKNRYPVLMVDRFIVDNDNPNKGLGVKNFSFNEYYWKGHFEDNPVAPGMILIESMIESFLLVFLVRKEYRGKETSDSKINNIRFFKKVKPGDTLKCYSELTYLRRGVARGSVKGYVDDEMVCCCDIEAVIPELLIKVKMP